MKTLFTSLSLLFLCAAGYSQMPDSARLNRFFDRLAEKNKAMGSLLVAKDGKALYTRSIGYSQSSRGEKKALTAASRYRIGSVTKMFTAVLILQLAEQGKLRLDDPLKRFFPGLPNADKITVAQLLAHRSGIRDVAGDPAFRALHKRTEPIAKEDMLEQIAQSKPDFEPGAQYAYSNTGYYLLGCIAEQASGQSYSDLLAKSIAAKIGLADTYPAGGPIDPGKNECFSYKYGRDWEQQPETHPSVLFGAGTLISTPADLGRFIRALFNLELISQTSLERMKQEQMGMDTFSYHGKTAYGHTGGVDGFGAWLAYVPEEKLAVAYAANGKVYPVGDIIDGVFAMYWNKPFEIPGFEALILSPEVLDQYTGVYAIGEAAEKFTFTITREGSTLYMQAANKPSAMPLQATAQDAFKVEAGGMIIEFDVARKQMTLIRNGQQKVFHKE